MSPAAIRYTCRNGRGVKRAWAWCCRGCVVVSACCSAAAASPVCCCCRAAPAACHGSRCVGGLEAAGPSRAGHQGQRTARADSALPSADLAPDAVGQCHAQDPQPADPRRLTPATVMAAGPRWQRPPLGGRCAAPRASSRCRWCGTATRPARRYRRPLQRRRLLWRRSRHHAWLGAHALALRRANGSRGASDFAAIMRSPNSCNCLRPMAERTCGNHSSSSSFT
jgi:hypothetical protein